MATVFHRANALRIFHTRIILRREFSVSASVYKKRSKQVETTFEDDFFDSGSEDLFSSSSSTSTSEEVPSNSAETAKDKDSAKIFDQQLAYISDRLGPKPKANHPQARSTAISNLLHVASKPDQLERLASVLEAWRRDDRQVNTKTTIQIIDRCLLYKPDLLVRLFADRRKYGLTIPSQEEARRILRTLTVYRPHNVITSKDIAVKRAANASALRSVATFAALLPSHGLKPVTEDLTCAALLGQACAKNIPLENATASSEKSARRPVQLSSASLRALSSLSGKLVHMLSSNEAEQNVVANIDRIDRLGKVNHKPSVLEKRNYGFTQSKALEWLWVTKALKDIVNVLEGRDNPYSSILSNVLEQRQRYLPTRSDQAQVA